MPELRWTLLILGALFIVGLALWEFRRQRHAPRQNLSSGASSGDSAPEPVRFHREPTISLPELHPEPRIEPAGTQRAREPAHDPPVVEVDAASFAHLQAQSEAPGEPADDEPPDALYADTVAVSANDGFTPPRTRAPWGTAQSDFKSDASLGTAHAASKSDASWGTEHAPSKSDASWGTEHAPSKSDASWGTAQSAPRTAAPGGATTPPAEAAASGFTSPASSTGFVSDSDHEPEAQPLPRESNPVGATAGAPVVDWPREETRKIVALRLVSAPAARFPGRAVRQALAAEGFVLGKFDIFHKAGPDERAVLSAASLTKPGTFALSTIDAQRFGGISLFAVLPGPLPPQETFDELLTTARNLNDRLQGALQDERGEPLTPTRSATIRQSLSDGKESGGGTEPHPETRQ